VKNDWLLLRDFVEKRSEAAFAELVNKHMKLVYWTCRRDLDHAQLAEDATQAVFLLLAQKADSMRRGTSISGWLFQAARLVSRNAARNEARRRKSEQEAAQLVDQSLRASHGDQDIEPWLNDALAALSESDRNAILMRYFDGLSLHEAAVEIGVSEKALSQRVNRAIEKMRHFLRKKRVTIGSSALLAVLTDHATMAPESCHAATLHAVQQLAAGHTAAATASLQKGVLITMQVTKYKYAVAGATLLLLATSAMLVVSDVRARDAKASGSAIGMVTIPHTGAPTMASSGSAAAALADIEGDYQTYWGMILRGDYTRPAWMVPNLVVNEPDGRLRVRSDGGQPIKLTTTDNAMFMDITSFQQNGANATLTYKFTLTAVMIEGFNEFPAGTPITAVTTVKDHWQNTSGQWINIGPCEYGELITTYDMPGHAVTKAYGAVTGFLEPDRMTSQ